MRYVTVQAFEEIIAAVKSFCGKDNSKPIHILTVNDRPECKAMSFYDGNKWINNQPAEIRQDLHVTACGGGQIYVWKKEDEQRILEGGLCIV